MATVSADERLFGSDTFERAGSLCRRCIDVLFHLKYFRLYVTRRMTSGRFCDYHDSPKSLRKAICELRSQLDEEESVPKGYDVWTLIPLVKQANADHLHRIHNGEFFVLTATEAIFGWAKALENEAFRACLWVPSGAMRDSPEHDPQWAGPGATNIPSVADLEVYQDVLRSIQKWLRQWKITEKNLLRLECWIEEEQVRTQRYLLDLGEADQQRNQLREIAERVQAERVLVEDPVKTKKVKPDGMSWQVAKELAEVHVARNGWPGLNALADLIQCSPATMSKARNKSPKLREAEAAHSERMNSGRGNSINDAVLDNTPQTTEDDPAEAVATEEILQKLRRQLAPAEQATLNAKTPAEQRLLVTLWEQQQRDGKTG